jgi:hypothetical protein
MKTTEQKIEKVQKRSVSGAIHVRSAEGHGVGRSSAGADDARQLAREAARRALEITARPNRGTA